MYVPKAHMYYSNGQLIRTQLLFGCLGMLNNAPLSNEDCWWLHNLAQQNLWLNSGFVIIVVQSYSLKYGN